MLAEVTMIFSARHANSPETASDMYVARELLVKHPAIRLPMHRKEQVWRQIQIVPLTPP
jgi:hypothetical protein